MDYFIFKLIVVTCVFYLYAELVVWINDYSDDDIPHSKSARDIHVSISKEKKY